MLSSDVISCEGSYANKPLLLEAYIQQCTSIEKNIDRRNALNRHMFAVVSGLAAAFGFVSSTPLSVPGDDRQAQLFIMLPVLIIVVSVAWFFQILRFREVSRMKFDVAIHLEGTLGFKCIGLEEQIMDRKSTIIEYTKIELLIPIAFALCGLALLFY